MGKIYKNQTKLILKLTANHDIAGATETTIKARKPSGDVIDLLPTTVEDDLTGILVFDNFITTTLDESGGWKFWTHVVFSDGKVADGEPVSQIVYSVGC